ncbi:hypothetical protein [Azospirillum sp.]|uniref:hypothetical protein n=1 Tax=Azospirillum sp. TaxID=34012 RepID=UPI003D720B9C
MPDSLSIAPLDLSQPDLSLILGPDDTAVAVGPCPLPDSGRRFVRGTVYVVVHRRFGLWTHVYRVLEEDRPGRMLVHLDKVLAGDRLDEARDWARPPGR